MKLIPQLQKRLDRFVKQSEKNDQEYADNKKHLKPTLLIDLKLTRRLMECLNFKGRELGNKNSRKSSLIYGLTKTAKGKRLVSTQFSGIKKKG